MITNEEGASAIIENCLKLYKNGIKKANKTLSTTLLFIMSFTLTSLVSELYITISFACFTGYNDGSGSTIVSIGYIIYSATNFCTICYLNALSQKVSNHLMKLLEQLTNLSNLDASAEHSKSQAIKLFNLFHGFDCCGFVTLGRPLLTSIITTIVTYTIILIQFKESKTF